MMRPWAMTNCNTTRPRLRVMPRLLRSVSMVFKAVIRRMYEIPYLEEYEKNAIPGFSLLPGGKLWL